MAATRPRVRILIADDHPLFSESLRKLLQAESDFQVVGEAADGAEALERARSLNPHILLLDLAMPRLGGLDALRGPGGTSSPARSVVLIAADPQEDIVKPV